jgi:enterochelin esterase-like enzyme
MKCVFRTSTALLLPAAALLAADVSARYRAELKSPGGGSMSLTGNLVQKGTAIEGSFGPTPAKAVPITNGRVIDDAQISFVIPPLDQSQFILRSEGQGFLGIVAEGTGLKSPFKTISLIRLGPLETSDLVPLLPNEGEHRSPRLLRLRHDLADGQPGVLDSFWAEVSQSGTPLVETGHDESALVTFIWRGRPEDNNVLVIWAPFTFAQPSRFFMLRVPRTDLWFLTLRLPRGARFDYRLSPNDPLATNPPGTSGRKPVKDPLNRLASRLDLSGAPIIVNEERPESGRLTIREHTLRSQALQQDRKILVYTPPVKPGESRRHPTLYLFDGEDRDGTVFATHTIEKLLTDGKIPPLVIVRVVNPDQAARQTQLVCHEPFLQFLTQELVPFVRTHYAVSAEPKLTAVGGYSLGGLAAAFAALRRSEVFGIVISQSGSFWWEPTGREWAEPNWIARQFLAAPKLPVRFFLESGLFELALSGRGGSALLPNRHLRDVLRAKGYEVKYREFAGGHEALNWRESFPEALIAMFGAQIEPPLGRTDR